LAPDKFSLKVKSRIENDQKYDELLLSAISPWEFCKLVEKRRLEISCNPEEWLEIALDMPKLRLVHLTPALAYKSTVLPGEFHADPADQIIVATARQEKAVIMTCDQRILNYKHAKCIW